MGTHLRLRWCDPGGSCVTHTRMYARAFQKKTAWAAGFRSGQLRSTFAIDLLRHFRSTPPCRFELCLGVNYVLKPSCIDAAE